MLSAASSDHGRSRGVRCSCCEWSGPLDEAMRHGCTCLKQLTSSCNVPTLNVPVTCPHPTKHNAAAAPCSWSPYKLYSNVDLIYSEARWRTGDRFCEAQSVSDAFNMEGYFLGEVLWPCGVDGLCTSRADKLLLRSSSLPCGLQCTSGVLLIGFMHTTSASTMTAGRVVLEHSGIP
jgi:hypothetical protein